MKRLVKVLSTLFCMICLIAILTAREAESSILFDDFLGTIVSSGNWHIPTWMSPTDGTFIGQTQFRCSQNAPLPAAYNSNAIIALDTYNPTGASFYGTDLISNLLFTRGQGPIVTIRAKMNDPIPAGIVGGIFLYAPPATGSSLHDEIDFELLTNDPNNVHTNIYGNEPFGVGNPTIHSFNSGSITDYHTYQIQWLPNQVSWFVDGDLFRTVTTQSPIPEGSMYVHFNIWVPDPEFGGAYNPDLHYTTSPSSNQTFSMSVDWVSVSTDIGLTITKSGAGTGTICSNPEGMNCGISSNTCSTQFPLNQIVALSATPAAGGSIFSGWGGYSDCIDGIISMITDRTCSAIFNQCNSASITKTNLSGPFSSITAAYIGAEQTDNIRIIASNQQEDLVFSGKKITLKSGYDCTFTEPPTSFTTITGSIAIFDGLVTLGEGQIKIQ